MKFAQGRPYADPEAAARKLIEIANSVEGRLELFPASKLVARVVGFLTNRSRKSR
jgi:hypothetical protein